MKERRLFDPAGYQVFHMRRRIASFGTELVRSADLRDGLRQRLIDTK